MNYATFVERILIFKHLGLQILIRKYERPSDVVFKFSFVTLNLVLKIKKSLVLRI